MLLPASLPKDLRATGAHKSTLPVTLSVPSPGMLTMSMPDSERTYPVLREFDAHEAAQMGAGLHRMLAKTMNSQHADPEAPQPITPPTLLADAFKAAKTGQRSSAAAATVELKAEDHFLISAPGPFRAMIKGRKPDPEIDAHTEVLTNLPST